MTIALGASSAVAQQGDASRDAEARSLFQAGKVAYNRGDFEPALEYFQRSYALSGRPALLFNIATAADRLRRDAIALEALEAYLPHAPAERRELVESRIRVLRERDAESEANTAEAPGGDAEPTQPAPRGPGAAPWILVGGGGAALVLGTVLFALGRSDIADAEDADVGSTYADVADAADRAPLRTGLGLALAGAGLAACAAGLGWALAGGDEDDAVALTVHPSGMTLRGQW